MKVNFVNKRAMTHPASRRVRWLTKEEVTRLLNALPPHQRQLARFAPATGLRQANVLGLRWSEVDLARSTARVHADEAKGSRRLANPLGNSADFGVRNAVSIRFAVHFLRRRIR